MTRSDPIWRPLQNELLRWEENGRVAHFWLRDDDAVVPTSALDRLLELTADSSVPVMLAVVPRRTGEPLIRRLAEERLVAVAVHGWSHENHAADGDKKQELGPHRPRETVLAELSEANGRLAALYPKQFVPVLVPPWNRIDRDLLPHLASVGFVALSVFGPPKPAPLKLINSDVDIIDWHTTRGCRDHASLIAEIVAKLRRNFEDGQATLGLLTHHLVHDEPAWLFLKGLFEATRTRSRWLSMNEMLPIRA